MTRLDELLYEMIRYDDRDVKRIQHFLKVHEFARLIGLEEKLDPYTQEILEAAAIVHDIGIHKAEEKYGPENIRSWRDRARRGPCLPLFPGPRRSLTVSAIW